MKHTLSVACTLLKTVMRALPLRPALTALLITPLAALHATEQPATAGRPNVLLLIADDLAVRLGCYGDALAKTPGLDRLAAEGVLFERAYAQGVVCTPSRKSFLSGLSTKVVGAGSDNYLKAHSETMTVSRWFRQHGYQTIGIGKIEHTMDFIDPQGWDLREPGEGGDNRGKTRNFLKASDDAPQDFATVDTRTDTGATMDIVRGERLVSFWRKEWKREKPFFAALGFHTPHLPYDTQQRYIAMHDLARMPLAMTPVDASQPLAHALPFPPFHPPADKQRQAIQGYYAAVSMMDGVVTHVLDYLREQSLLDNTLVIFIADQGYHLGYRGLWCKHSLYPGTLHVPLIVRYPKAAVPGARAAGIVELLDLFPTLTELAGLPSAEGLHGTSFMRLLKEPQGAGKPAAFADDARGGHAVYTKDWAYIERQPVGEYELYNLGADPECFRNLAGKAEHLATQQRQAQQLRHFFPTQRVKAR
jgi:uncharacterized sulfatase